MQMSLSLKAKLSEVLNSSRTNYDQEKNSISKISKSTVINLKNTAIPNLKRINFQKIKSKNTKSSPNLIKIKENGLYQICDNENGYISNSHNSENYFDSIKFSLFLRNNDFQKKSNNFNSKLNYDTSHFNLINSNNNSIKKPNDLTFQKIPIKNNSIINFSRNNNFLSYLENKINLPKPTLSITTNNINSINYNNNNIKNKFTTNDNYKNKYINLNLNPYLNKLEKNKFMSFKNLSTLDSLRTNVSKESLYYVNNYKTKNFNSEIFNNKRSTISANNKIKNKIIKMEQEYSLKNQKNSLINRPPRTLNSQLFQFNKNEFKLISPTLYAINSSRIRESIKKDKINNHFYKKIDYSFNSNKNKKNIEKNFNENNNFKKEFEGINTNMKLKTILGREKKKNMIDKKLIENQRINKIKYEKINNFIERKIAKNNELKNYIRKSNILRNSTFNSLCYSNFSSSKK